MKTDEVLALLRRRCDEAGGQKAWATTHKISGAYVSDVLNGRRDPGDSILRHLGLEKVVTYQKVSHKPSDKAPDHPLKHAANKVKQ